MMTRFRGLMGPILLGLALLAALLAFLPATAEANGPEGQDVGAQADLDVALSNNSGRLPRLALSTDNSYLAVVYQQGNTVLIRSNDGVNGWIGSVALVGSGAAPGLAFTDPDTAHVVWVDNSRNQIFQAACNLTPTSAACTPLNPINPDLDQTVESPVIVYNSSGNYLYVAWVNNTTGQVVTARSTNNGASWDSPFQTITGANLAGSTIALAAANDTIHLAFVNNGGGAIEYRNTPVGTHIWGNARPFGPAANYDKVSNPALAASGANVYLTWDSSTSADPDDKYALMGILSTSGGVGNWADNNVPRHITSTVESGSGTIEDQKLTRDSGGSNPLEEAGLRPSLAITGTNNFVVVWQERPNTICEDTEPPTPPSNGTSEINYAQAADPGLAPEGNWWNQSGPLANDLNTYDIDPDIVVNPATQIRHIVFMKALISSPDLCGGGGGATDYAIYYRGPEGPFTTIQEPPPPPGGGGPVVFLPIIRK